MNREVLSGRIIPYLAFVTGMIALAAALAVRLLAHDEFNSFGESAWWAAQTVTTVGYGDVIPRSPFSKVVAVLVMFLGIATVSLMTALITSAVISETQKRSAEVHGDPELSALQRIELRLDALQHMEQQLDAIERRLSPTDARILSPCPVRGHLSRRCGGVRLLGLDVRWNVASGAVDADGPAAGGSAECVLRKICYLRHGRQRPGLVGQKS